MPRVWPVRAEGLAPNLYCLVALQQAGYLAGGERIVVFDHGAHGIGVELALSLVGAAGQVIAVADGGLSDMIVVITVVTYDGAHVRWRPRWQCRSLR